VRMPGVDGLELCRRVRAAGYEDLPFVFCSAATAVPDRVAGLQTGADDYLLKPVDPQELALRVRRLVETHRRVARLRSRNDASGDEAILSGNLAEVRPPDILQFVGDLGIRSFEVTFVGGTRSGSLNV